MSRSQRLTFLAIAAAIAVVAVGVLLVTGGKDGATVGAPGSGAGASSGTGTATPSKASAGPVPLLTAGKVAKLTYTQGDRVRFRVRVDHADELHVHGYEIEKPLEAGKPLTIAFKATINGIFEVELHHANVQIGRLTVEPG
jgi:hypothetical protein